MINNFLWLALSWLKACERTTCQIFTISGSCLDWTPWGQNGLRQCEQEMRKVILRRGKTMRSSLWMPGRFLINFKVLHLGKLILKTNEVSNKILEFIRMPFYVSLWIYGGIIELDKENRAFNWAPDRRFVVGVGDFSQAQFQSSPSPVQLELRLALSLIITTHPPPPTRESRDAA